MNKVLMFLLIGLSLHEVSIDGGQKRKAEQISPESEALALAEHAPDLFFEYFDKLVESSKTLPELKLNIANFRLVHSQWKDIVDSMYGRRRVIEQQERILEDIQQQIVSFCRKAPQDACNPMPNVTKDGIDGIVKNRFDDPLISWVIRYTKKDGSQRAGHDLLKTLLDNDALVNVSNDKGDTPLILASWFGKTGMVNMLLAAGADVDQTNNFDSTALMAAAEEGQKFIVESLLAKGANKKRVNHKGETAFDIAQRRYKETGQSVYNQIATKLSPKKKY